MSYRPDDPFAPGRPPRSEPEIIPPGQPDPRRRRAAPGFQGPQPVWTTTQRMVFRAPGPLGMLLGLVAVGAIVAAILVAFLGIFIFLLPTLGLIAAGFILARMLGGRRRL